MADRRKEVIIDYTNWRGERSMRLIRPIDLNFENNEWHPETQWLLEAIDVTTGQGRFFAVANIHSWRPAHAPTAGEEK